MKMKKEEGKMLVKMDKEMLGDILIALGRLIGTGVLGEDAMNRAKEIANCLEVQK